MRHYPPPFTFKKEAIIAPGKEGDTGFYVRGRTAADYPAASLQPSSLPPFPLFLAHTFSLVPAFPEQLGLSHGGPAEATLPDCLVIVLSLIRMENQA